MIAERAMISTPHHLATAIGMEVLRSGGNAVDAAVAASAGLMATVPMQCSPGGDAIWIIRRPDGEVAVLDASG
ncbi:MAG: gamma-glutamyltransferase, partial [Hypericibacter sp.]